MSFDQRIAENNFDLLRFLFAGTVCIVHASRFSGYEQLAIIGQILESAVAVHAFFVVSGFLIFMSYERSGSIISYAGKRLRRIYPAYAAIILLCAFGLVFASTKNAVDYFSVAWLKYVAANMLFMNFLQPSLPGVFESNLQQEINGSLWTIKVEVMFYILVPLFVSLFRRFSPLSVIVVISCLSLTYVGILHELFRHAHMEFLIVLARQLPGQLSWFMAGAFFYYYFHLFERWLGYFLVGAVLLLVFRTSLPLNIFQPFALATVVIFFGMFLYAGNFGKYGDFSYGLYIVHFPLLQLLVWLEWFRESPWVFLLVLVLGSILCAIAMWHLVEKHFLLRNNHYITAEKGQADVCSSR